jgi:hypothetical protein
MNTAERIAKLEAEIADLKAIEAKRVSESAPKRPAFHEPRVRITEIPNGIPCPLPDLKQMQKLMTTVAGEFPKWDPFSLEAFRWAFTALGSRGRMETPDRQHASWCFVQHCESWLRSHGVATDIGPAWTCAALAWGDICWVVWRIDGQVPEWGLNCWAGKPAMDEGWRRILNEGASAILPPMGPALRVPPRSPSRVIFVG